MTLSFEGDALITIYSFFQCSVYNVYLVHWKLTFCIILAHYHHIFHVLSKTNNVVK